MNEIIALIIRQMRRPGLVLIASYAVAVLGMSLIPMIGEDGEITRMSLFHSFYWVSYTATTVGFGEVPVPFSDMQRMWVAFSIYYTVPSWLYALGKMIALLQDTTFQHALSENRFARKVAKNKQHFVIVCGFGEVGSRLVHLLLEENYQCIVIEKNADTVNKMVLDSRLHRVFALAGDASNVELLLKAGIGSPLCRAVMAITDCEAVNIKVALSAKLLYSDHSNFKIICRTTTRKGSANAKSFNSDVVLNTNQIFAERLTVSLRRPSIAQLLDRLFGAPGAYYTPQPQPPSGRWIICGYDLLGKNLERLLGYEGVETLIISNDNQRGENHVRGVGTEAVTLREARIDSAHALVAAYDYDPDNLSIVMTAKAMHPDIFVVGKQNRSSNRPLFAVAGFERVMEEADLIVSQAFLEVARPILSRFVSLIHLQDEKWGFELLKQFQKLAGNYNPGYFVVKVGEKYAPALFKELNSGLIIRLQNLWMLSYDEDTFNDAFALLLLRDRQEIILPKAATTLQVGDKVLIAYHKSSTVQRIRRFISDEAELHYAMHGKEKARSYVMNYILKKLD